LSRFEATRLSRYRVAATRLEHESLPPSVLKAVSAPCSTSTSSESLQHAKLYTVVAQCGAQCGKRLESDDVASTTSASSSMLPSAIICARALGDSLSERSVSETSLRISVLPGLLRQIFLIAPTTPSSTILFW